MSKRLVLMVDGVTEMWDQPQKFSVELSDNVIDRIRALSKAVTELGVVAIEENADTGTWAYVEETFDDDDEHEEAYADGNGFKDVKVKTSVSLLRVFGESFQFVCTPRETDQNVVFFTSKVPISELDSPESYVTC